MLCRPCRPANEHPAVAAVEQILETATSTGGGGAGGSNVSHLVAVDALWICACISNDDAPTWLIYDFPDGGLAWQRVPDGVEPLDLIDARSNAGGHADPAEVLRWLTGRRGPLVWR